MTKLTLKVEGLDKLDGELRKEAEKAVAEEIRKQRSKEIKKESISPEISDINSNFGTLTFPSGVSSRKKHRKSP